MDTSLESVEYDLTINFNDLFDEPLQNVEVELKDENNVLLETHHSNASGQVVFTNNQGYLPYTVTYSLNGYIFLAKMQALYKRASSPSFLQENFNSNYLSSSEK